MSPHLYCPTAIPFKDISAHTDLSACPSASIYHLESIIFHSVYHSSLYVLSTSADNCFPTPSALCLRLFIAPLLLCRPQSMAPPSPHRSTLSRLLICAKGCRGREGGTADLLATPGPAMDYLHLPVTTILIYPLFPPVPFFLGRPMEDRVGRGGCCISAVVRWAAGVY